MGVYSEDLGFFGDTYSQELTKLNIDRDRGREEIAYLSEEFKWGEILSIRLLNEFYRAASEIAAVRYIDLDISDLR